MSTFCLQLLDATRSAQIDGVVSFVAQDRSGSFGILAGHARFMTALSFGLARYRLADGVWQYLALPGGVLYFKDNTLNIATRRYLHDSDYERISTQLTEQLLVEEEALRAMKQSLHQMEDDVLRRLWELSREAR